jgi:thioesterase domain-containing protein
MAQQLIAQGETVSLVLLEVPYPTSYERAGPTARLLQPVAYWSTKLTAHARDMARLPLRDWGSSLTSKGRRLGAALSPTQQAQIHTTGTSAVARLTWTTLQAVASYQPRPYPAPLLHVISAKRAPEGDGSTGSRELWMQLADGSSRTIGLPAEDSGRLFVTPHVEKLADILARHAQVELPRSVTSDSPRTADGPSGIAAIQRRIQ